MRALLLEFISLPVVLVNYVLYMLENMFREDLLSGQVWSTGRARSNNRQSESVGH